MSEIKKIVIQILIKNGFSNVISIKDRMYQIRIAQNSILAFLAVLSIFLFQNLLDILIWFLIFIVCLIIEQSMGVFYLWITHNWKGIKGSFRASVLFLESINRSLYERINFLFVGIFILASLYFAPLSPYSAFALGGFFSPSLLLIARDNNRVKTKKRDDTLPSLVVSIGLELFRGWRQVVSIISQGFRIAISGVFLAVLLGSVSQDFWLIISQISWTNLIITLSLLFIFAIIPSSSHINQSIELEISKLKLSEDPLLPQNLFYAISRCIPLADARKVSRTMLNEYENLSSWKLKRQIHKLSLENISTEMKTRAKWQFWISLFGLMPLTFVLVSVVSLIIFPPNVLANWTGKVISYDILSWMSQLLELFNARVTVYFLDDPILKFSAVITALVLTYFANSYSQDSSKVFKNLHIEEILIDDLIVALCAYYVFREPNYQIVGGFHIPVGSPNHALLLQAPIILIPSNIEISSIETIITNVKELYKYDERLICAIFVTTERFLISTTAINMRLIEKEEHLLTIGKTPQQCWVWLDKGNNATGLYKFSDFESARIWSEKNTIDRDPK